MNENKEHEVLSEGEESLCFNFHAKNIYRDIKIKLVLHEYNNNFWDRREARGAAAAALVVVKDWNFTLIMKFFIVLK